LGEWLGLMREGKQRNQFRLERLLGVAAGEKSGADEGI
jgi:hypothetical protein